MQIRRNTKPFKTLLEILETCRDRPDRKNLVRLYITKAGNPIANRIHVEGIADEAGVFYDMSYNAVVGNMRSSNHQLYQSDEIPGIYFFRSNLSKEWDETPFEFDPKVVKEFSTLPELPTVREKEKPTAFDINADIQKSKTQVVKKEAVKKENLRKEEAGTSKAPMFVDKGPKQPDYKLDQKIQFTNLDRIVFRQPQLNKKEVLDYYNKIADYMLPYLKDRPHSVRLQADNGPNPSFRNLKVLPRKLGQQIPEWTQDANVSGSNMFLTNDKEHLLVCVELEAVEFDSCLSRLRYLALPDYAVIHIDSGSEFFKAIDVALVAKSILDGLKLPSFVKTDGLSGLHIYLPLDSRSEFEAAKDLTEFICKLIRLKVPDLVTIKGIDDYGYGKVTLDGLVNEEGEGVVAPYSLVAGGAATAATPLAWDEVVEGLRVEEFNHETIFARLKKEGDPFEELFKKKINADEELGRMKEHYSFLV
jgi:bifunctional non-homologous end joining protein LigD